MKIQVVPLGLPLSKAKQEINRYLKIGYICVLIGFFLFPAGFGLIGGALGFRCTLITYNSKMKKQSTLTKLRVLSYILMFLGILETFSQFLINH